MEAIPALKPDSNAGQIAEFIAATRKQVSALECFGILGLAQSISYNESYFGEKEGLIKSLIQEGNIALKDINNDLSAVVPEDTSAFSLVREALDKVPAAVKSVRQILEIVTGTQHVDPGIAGSQDDEEAKLVKQRLESYINASEASRAIYEAVTQSSQLIDGLELLAGLQRQLAEASMEPSTEDEEEDVEAESEAEDHIQADEEDIEAQEEKKEDKEEDEAFEEGEAVGKAEGEEEASEDEEKEEKAEKEDDEPRKAPEKDQELEVKADAQVDPAVANAMDNKVFDGLRQTLEKAKALKDKADEDDTEAKGDEEAVKEVTASTEDDILTRGWKHMRDVQKDPNFQKVKVLHHRYGDQEEGLLDGIPSDEPEVSATGSGLLGIAMGEPELVEEPVADNVAITATVPDLEENADGGLLGEVDE